MPDLKISELVELETSATIGNGISNNDYLTVLDVSETLPENTNKKIKVSTLHEFLAPINSPVLTGLPQTTTPPINDSSTRIANTQFVDQNIDVVTQYIDNEVTTLNTSIATTETSLTNYVNTQLTTINLVDLNDVNISGLGTIDTGKYVSYNHTGTQFQLTDKAGTDIGNLLKVESVSGAPGLPALNGSNLTNLTIPAGAGSPLTTKGDVYIYGTSNQRLPIGLDETTLVADSTSPTGVVWKQTQGTNLQTFATPIATSFSLFDSYHGQLIRINTNTNNVTVTFINSGIREGFQVTLFNAGTNSVIINTNSQTLLSRGLNLININSACSLSYNAATSTWFGIGDLS